MVHNTDNNIRISASGKVDSGSFNHTPLCKLCLSVCPYSTTQEAVQLLWMCALCPFLLIGNEVHAKET